MSQICEGCLCATAEANKSLCARCALYVREQAEVLTAKLASRSRLPDAESIPVDTEVAAILREWKKAALIK